MRPELVFFIAFRLLGTQNWCILWREMQFWTEIFIENFIIRTKITVKVDKSEPNIPCSHETLNLGNSLKKKRNWEKIFLFRFLRWMSFLMLPLTFLYDEYIDRPKLTEQKNPFEYIVPAPTSGSEQKAGETLNSIHGEKWNLKIQFLN